MKVYCIPSLIIMKILLHHKKRAYSGNLKPVTAGFISGQDH